MNRLLFLYWGNLTNHLCKKTRLSLAIEEREEKFQKKEHWKGKAKWKEVWKASHFFLVKPIKKQDKATTVETQCSYHSSSWKERKDLLRTPRELLLHDWTQKEVFSKNDFFALKCRRGRGEKLHACDLVIDSFVGGGVCWIGEPYPNRCFQIQHVCFCKRINSKKS